MQAARLAKSSDSRLHEQIRVHQLIRKTVQKRARTLTRVCGSVATALVSRSPKTDGNMPKEFKLATTNERLPTGRSCLL